MTFSDRSRPVVMQLIRVMNQWKAYERRGHEVDGKPFTSGELQLLRAVAEFPDKNASGLAEQLGVTKGAISQGVSKLVKRGFLERYHAPGNERETYTRLTAAGSRVFLAHARQFETELADLEARLERAAPAQLRFMLDFLGWVEQFFREAATSTR